MCPSLPSNFSLSPAIEQALVDRRPIVTLESTVITHGLPYPQNLQLAMEMEEVVSQQGAIPATIAVLDGMVWVGLERPQLERLAASAGETGEPMHKISARDFAVAAVMGWSGGTTVAGTLVAAHQAGLKIFATGGIGGVHRHPPFDISADLIKLAESPLVVVCAGAKAILDLEATLEYLETHSVPVIGYQTDEFPAFYSLSSGLYTSGRADSPGQVAEIAQAHWSFGSPGAVLLTVPPPSFSALARELVESAIQLALSEAEESRLRGQAVTPFLLRRVTELTGGESLRANLDLLKNNARVAGQVAHFLVED